MCLLPAADLKLQVDNLRQSEEKLLAKARHRDSVLEDKIRDLRLVSQERDRLQASLREGKLESKISGPQAAQVRYVGIDFRKNLMVELCATWASPLCSISHFDVAEACQSCKAIQCQLQQTVVGLGSLPCHCKVCHDCVTC